jgi:hypothetical protein
MSNHEKKVYLQSEEYKLGWIHGLYDARPDDGAFYGTSNQSPCNAAIAYTGRGAARLYNEGYRNGSATRATGELRRSGNGWH